MLKKNPSERISFNEFFNNQFVTTGINHEILKQRYKDFFKKKPVQFDKFFANYMGNQLVDIIDKNFEAYLEQFKDVLYFEGEDFIRNES